MANDQVVIDLSNYKDKVGSRVPEGRYRVVVQDAENDKSNAGNAMINLWFDVVEGPEKGSAIIDRLVLTEKSLFRVVAFMQAIGLPTPKKRLQVNIKSWVGKVLDIDVEDGDPYNGRVKSEVRGYSRVKKAPTTETAALDDSSTGSEAPVADWEERVNSLLGDEPAEEVDPDAHALDGHASEGFKEFASTEVPDTVNLDELNL